MVNIDEITRRLNEIVEPLLTRNDDGSFREDDGYLRRSKRFWPRYSDDLVNWVVSYEFLISSYESTGTVYFSYASDEQNFLKRRGYFIAHKYVSEDLETALSEFRNKMQEVKKKGR